MRRIRVPGAAMLLLVAAGCYDSPVRQSLIFSFPESGVEITVRTEVREQGLGQENEALLERIALLRRELAAGRDAFTASTVSLAPLRDVTSLTREDGEPVALERTLTLEDRNAVKRFFSASNVTAIYSEGPEFSELTFLPRAIGSATREQADQAERAEAGWADSFAYYQQALQAFWGFVQDHPERRARMLDGALGEDSTDGEGGGPGEDPLAAEEQAVTVKAREAVDDLLGRLVVPDGQAFTPSELVRLAHDPFPADVSVKVQGTVLEVEGFEARGSVYRVPALDLEQALWQLDRAWIRPGLVAHKLRGYRDASHEGTAPVVDDPRTAQIVLADPPSAAQVRARLAELLKHPDAFRLRWKRPGPETSASQPPG